MKQAQLTMAVADSAEHVVGRINELAASDAQFRDALPIQAFNDSKMRPELGLAEIASVVMKA